MFAARRTGCALYVSILVVAIIAILVRIEPSSANEPNLDSGYQLVKCEAMTPEEAVARFPDTTMSDWYRPVDNMIVYDSKKFLEVMIEPDEYVKAHDDDTTVEFYDSTYGSGRMHTSATKLTIVCLDSYEGMPFVDDASLACPVDPVGAVFQFTGTPEGWTATVDPRLKLTMLSYIAPSAEDKITIVVPKEVLAITNGGSFGPGSVIPNVRNLTLRMYCSQNLTVES